MKYAFVTCIVEQIVLAENNNECVLHSHAEEVTIFM